MRAYLAAAVLLAAAPVGAQSTRVGDKKYDGQSNTVEYKTDAKGVVAAETFKSVQWIIKNAKPPTAEDSFLRMMVDAPSKTAGGKESRMGYELLGDALRVLSEERPSDSPYHGFPKLKEPYRTAVKRHAQERLANRASSDYFKRVRKEFPGKSDLEIAYWEIASNMVVYTPDSTEGNDKDTGRIVAKKFMLLPFTGDEVDFKKTPPGETPPAFQTERLSNMFADVAAVRQNALVHVEERVSPSGGKRFFVVPGKQPGAGALVTENSEARRVNPGIRPAQAPYGELYALNTSLTPGPSNMPLGRDIALFLTCYECGTERQEVYLIKVISANPGVSPDVGLNRPRVVNYVRYAVDQRTGEVNVASARPYNGDTISDDPVKQRHPDSSDNWVFNPYVIKDWRPAR